MSSGTLKKLDCCMDRKTERGRSQKLQEYVAKAMMEDISYFGSPREHRKQPKRGIGGDISG
jgi:hypothetical protein